MLKDEKTEFYCGVTLEDNPQKIKNNFSVETDKDSFLIKCTEKPQVVTDNIKGTGFSIFNDKTIRVIKETYETNPEKLFDLCDSFNYLVESGYVGKAFMVADIEFNINTLSDFSEAEKHFE
jgi:dTDP-glucose pyrophosphorylase